MLTSPFLVERLCSVSRVLRFLPVSPIRSLAVAAFDLVYCSLSVLRFVFVLDITKAKVKATTIRTMTRRAQLVCDSPDSLQDETDYLNNVFSKNNYNTDFVRRNTHSNTDSNSQTLALLRQRLYRTSEAPLKLLHVYYNLIIYVLRTNR